MTTATGTRFIPRLPAHVLVEEDFLFNLKRGVGGGGGGISEKEEITEEEFLAVGEACQTIYYSDLLLGFKTEPF